MLHIKINDILYPASVLIYKQDHNWDMREDIEITVNMFMAEAESTFVDNLVWSTIEVDPQTGDPIAETEIDRSEYCCAGPILDYRNGTVTVKMGKLTDHELLEIITGE